MNNPLEEPYKLFQKCFTVLEMDYLLQQPAFQRRFVALECLDDFEVLVNLGNELLLETTSPEHAAPLIAAVINGHLPSLDGGPRRLSLS